MAVQARRRRARQQLDQIHVPVGVQHSDTDPSPHFEILLKLDRRQRMVDRRSNFSTIKPVLRVSVGKAPFHTAVELFLKLPIRGDPPWVFPDSAPFADLPPPV